MAEQHNGRGRQRRERRAEARMWFRHLTAARTEREQQQPRVLVLEAAESTDDTETEETGKEIDR